MGEVTKEDEDLSLLNSPSSKKPTVPKKEFDPNSVEDALALMLQNTKIIDDTTCEFGTPRGDDLADIVSVENMRKNGITNDGPQGAKVDLPAGKKRQFAIAEAERQNVVIRAHNAAIVQRIKAEESIVYSDEDFGFTEHSVDIITDDLSDLFG